MPRQVRPARAVQSPARSRMVQQIHPLGRPASDQIRRPVVPANLPALFCKGFPIRLDGPVIRTSLVRLEILMPRTARVVA